MSKTAQQIIDDDQFRREWNEEQRKWAKTPWFRKLQLEGDYLPEDSGMTVDDIEQEETDIA